MRNLFLLAATCSLVMLAAARIGRSAETTGKKQPRRSELPNVKLPTLGGKQFWADHRVFRQWRIQRNVLTGHFRLLDDANRRHAWGSFEDCNNRLEAIKQERDLPPLSGKAVIVLHGLFRSRRAIEKMGRHLSEKGDYHLVSVGYPSTRGTVEEHARGLASVIDGLEGIDHIDLVAHSLGNLVIRHYWADATDPKQGRTPDRRIKRIVMLGPPNHGAELAEKLAPLDVSGKIVGAATRQIAYGWEQLEPKLATPTCEFAILAGGRGDEQGANPLVSGDDDLVVSVDSTKLSGARDFRVLPVWHTKMSENEKVQELTLRFLQQGYFETEATRQTIDKLQGQPVEE